MSNVNDYVNEAVEEINERNSDNCKRAVGRLVEEILSNEGHIKTYADRNVQLKSKLKELQMPEAVKVEL